MRKICIGFVVLFLLMTGYALKGDELLPSARAEGEPSGKIAISPTGESESPDRRQDSAPPRRGQGAKGVPAAQLSHPVAVLLGKEVIKHWVDVALHDPDPMAEMLVFMDVVNAVSVEDVELVIQILKNDQIAQWEAALMPLSGVMSSKERETILEALQIPAVKTWVLTELKQILLFKLAQREERLTALMGRAVIKHWVDTALHNPDPMAEMLVFMDVVNEISVEDVELVMWLLENDNAPPLNRQSALMLLSDVMSPTERETILEALQIQAVKTWALAELKQIHLFKLAQKAEKKQSSLTRGEQNAPQ